MFVLKSHHAPELSGPNCHAKLSHFETVAEKYSSSDVSTVFCSLTKKHIYIACTQNPKESPTVHTYSNQKERCHDKMPVHTINFQKSVGELQVIEKTPV